MNQIHRFINKQMDQKIKIKIHRCNKKQKNQNFKDFFIIYFPQTLFIIFIISLCQPYLPPSTIIYNRT